KTQPNAFNETGSPVDKFSFIGDNGHDTSNVDYYVDDIVLTVDRPIPIAPFVAPGRRKLFFDTWNDGLTSLRSKPSCLAAIYLAALGRWNEVDVRLAGLHAAWKDDPRLPLLLATIGLARADLDSAERPLRASAARVADDPRLECALVALSKDLDLPLVDRVRS